MTDNYTAIRQAIQNMEQVIAIYQDHEREMCPHVLGVKRDKKTGEGRKQALFFQFAGSSKTGLPPGGQWRCIPVDDLENVRTRKGPWHTGTGHSRPQTCVDEVDVEVPY